MATIEERLYTIRELREQREDLVIDMGYWGWDETKQSKRDGIDARCDEIEAATIADWNTMQSMLCKLDDQMRGDELGYCIDLSDDDMKELQDLVDRMRRQPDEN